MGIQYEYITSSEYIGRPREEVPLRGIWDGLKENTTAHGIPHVEIARGKCKRISWLIISVGVLGVMLYHLQDIFSKFLDRPINVNLKLLPGRELPFPAVTVCNMNPLKRSALAENNPELASLLLKSNKRRKKRAAGCGAGWDEFQGVCYFFSSITSNWADAKSACESMGSVLADIATVDENNFVLSKIGSGRYYFGLTRVAGNWVWLSGSTSTYRNWQRNGAGDPIEPNGSGPCGTVQAPPFDWRDIWCTGSYYHVCQIRAEPTTEAPTTDPPTTEVTTPGLTSIPPSTESQTTPALSTLGPTTQQPSTEEPTTQQPTTQETTTLQPTTEEVTTLQPSTEEQITLQPSTIEMTTLQPTTEAQTTPVQTTIRLTTSQSPSTEEPTTQAQTTIIPSTDVTTNLPSTEVQSSAASTTYITTQQTSTLEELTSQQKTTTKQTTTTVSSSEPMTDTSKEIKTATETTTTTSTTTTITLPPTTTPAPGATAPPPQTVPGSIFPERIQVRQEFQNEEVALETLADMPAEEKSILGYDASEFILDCQYSGYGCSPTGDFSKFYNGIHGNCFIFNSGWNSSIPVRQSERTGRRHGLKIVVNIDQAEYTDSFGEEAGARIVVHPQDRMPFPEDEGILTKPGQLTSIGIKKVSVDRLPSPYGTCVDEEKQGVNLTRNVYEEIYPVKYSTTGCMKTCYQRNVITECGCADSYYPKDGQAFPIYAHSCDSTNIVEDDCKYGVLRKFMNNELDCDCPRRCHDEFFVSEVSRARWPSDAQEGLLKAGLQSKIPQIVNNPNDTQRFRKDLLKVEVYYENLNYELVSERPAYGVFQFMSDLGGTLGLWLGFSLMTTFEFIEFGADLLVYGCLRLAGKGAGARGITDQGTPRRGPLHRRNRRKAAPAPNSRDSGRTNINTPLADSDIQLEDLDNYTEPLDREDDCPISPPPPYTSRNITPVNR